LITKNTTIPTKASQTFSTAEDNQTAVTIKVGQGERELAQHNKLLGEFNLEGIPPARRGMPQVEVTFDIDANGILKVSAKDKGTGKENKITIKANSGLSDAEIEQMIKDAELNADADKKQRELIEARNQAEAQIYEVKKDLGTYGDKIKPEEKAEIERVIEGVETAAKGDDPAKITEELTKVYPAMKALLDAKTAEEQANAQTEAAQADDVVDADFTEVNKKAA
jgi:molecular chaperone DnaK